MPSRSGYAGIVSRLAGLAVDVAVLALAVPAVSVLPGLAAEQVVGRTPGWLAATTSAVGAALPWVYFAGCWWLSGRTIGALVAGVTVRRHGGGVLGPVRAALRAGVGLLLFPVWLLGLAGVLVDRDRRAWHDLVFGTEVRYADRG